jgi:peptidoglycan L-alanyl-D-glutamate endopeptidase CwlK
MSNFKFSKRSLERLKGVDPLMVKLIERSLAKSPIDFGIPEHGGLRTAIEQRLLFNEGLSKADGTKHLSKHQSGKAVDVFAYINGKASWDPVHLAMIAGVVLSEAKEMNLKITWGGSFGSNDFKGWDMPHFQREEN